VALALAPTPSAGQRVDTAEVVVVEQRIALGLDLTPAQAKRRAIEEAMAEAVRRVLGVRVQSATLSIVDERSASIDGGFYSVVQLDAAGRAIDARVLTERWGSAQTPELGQQLYYEATIAVTVARDRGTRDPTFVVEATTDRSVYHVAGRAPAESDEIVVVARVSVDALVGLVSIREDSVAWLVPNAYSGWHASLAGAEFELPTEEWRMRGLRFRAVLPAGVSRSTELLAVVALKSAPPVPAKRMSLFDFQRWLVAIDADRRSIAFVPIEVRRR
jgi:hypothetical protein